jgi:uncharacterized membrane protein YhaH (DUF805 family)
MTLQWLLLSFEGRIGRKAYWFAVAVITAAQLAASLVDRLLFGPTSAPLSLLVWIAAIYPSLAVTAKRWHDRDKSAWWILIGLVPLVGVIWTIVENGFLKGTHGPNRFGPDPLS